MSETQSIRTVNGSWVLLLVLGASLLLSACATRPPRQTADVCAIFAEKPRWHRAAEKARRKWGLPVHVGMAFIARESSYQAKAKPPRHKILWVIPWRRQSTAYGYAQATRETWSEYLSEAGGFSADRDEFSHAIDFVGWYNHRSHKRLKIPKDDAYHLYLAYYSGLGGYARGTWKGNRDVQGYATKVARRAAQYEQQMRRCPKPRRRLLFW